MALARNSSTDTEIAIVDEKAKQEQKQRQKKGLRRRASTQQLHRTLTTTTATKLLLQRQRRSWRRNHIKSIPSYVTEIVRTDVVDLVLTFKKRIGKDFTQQQERNTKGTCFQMVAVVIFKITSSTFMEVVHTYMKITAASVRNMKATKSVRKKDPWSVRPNLHRHRYKLPRRINLWRLMVNQKKNALFVIGVLNLPGRYQEKTVRFRV